MTLPTVVVVAAERSDHHSLSHPPKYLHGSEVSQRKKLPHKSKLLTYVLFWGFGCMSSMLALSLNLGAS